MGVSIYAGITENYNGRPCMGPVIPFDQWQQTILADDCDERGDRGEDPFIPNPNYTPDAGLDLSGYNATMLFGLMGLDLGEETCANFPIDMVQKAALAARNGDAVSYTEDYSCEQNTRTSEVVDLATGTRTVNEVATGPQMISFGVPDGYVAERLDQLLRLITKGRQLGATHICVA